MKHCGEPTKWPFHFAGIEKVEICFCQFIVRLLNGWRRLRLVCKQQWPQKLRWLIRLYDLELGNVRVEGQLESLRDDWVTNVAVVPAPEQDTLAQQ
jgi:hypothetical protein